MSREKKLRLDRGSRFVLDIQPTRIHISGEVWFYQKGCQEKKLRLDRGSRFLLDIEPTRTNISGEVWCSFS